MAQSRRVFVGNLPHEITRDEVISQFKKYGTVESVEIKSKKDPTSGETLATFSFVNLNTDQETLSNCVFLLNGIKLGGRNIKVEAAKESFLQRLQRERESSQRRAVPPTSLASIPLKSSLNVSKDSEKEKKVKSTKEYPAVKIDSTLSEFSECDDDNKYYSSRNKLPMFKGTTAIVSIKPSSIAQSELRNKDSAFLNVSKEAVRNEVKIGRRNSSKAQPDFKTSDILKKFESFSDVWKDADEPSFGSNHTPKVENQERFESYNKNSLVAERGCRQQQRQPLHLEGKPNTLQEACIPSSINAAEAKRLKSLDAKREAFEQQKRAVKLALSDQSVSRINKIIVFDDDEDDSKKQKPSPKQCFNPKAVRREEIKQKAFALFDEESDDESAADWKKEFQVKKQFEGAKGKKLLELQSNFNNDDRFKLDERFHENDEETESKTSTKLELKTQQSADVIEGVEGLAEEREQQLQILSSILGQPISATVPAAYHESKTKGMLRFDPSKPNHLKFELSKEPKEKKRKKKAVASDPEEKDNEEVEDHDEEIMNTKVRRVEKDPEPVSQNKFYSVSDSLANSLRQSKQGQGSGFSLLQMFGSSPIVSESKKNYIEEPRKMNTEGLRKLPIMDDSSEEEEQEDKGERSVTTASVADQTASISSGPGIISSHGVWQQSFFLQPDDSRLNEGTAFFSQSDNTYDENFAKKREELKKFISRRWHDDWNREPPQKKGRSLQKRASSHNTRGYRSKKKQRR